MQINKQAFTLIELLVVVLIIGILAAVAVPQYRIAVAKARYTELMTTADAINKAEEIYYLANGKYTDNLNDLDITVNTSNVTIVFDFAKYHYEGHALAWFKSVREPGLSYLTYFKNHVNSSEVDYRGRRECRVEDPENEVLKKVCKNLTGKDGTLSYGIYLYVFP